MKKQNLKALSQVAKTLSGEQMKKIQGGIELRPICWRCCPDDPCSPIHHYCLDVVCPQTA